MACLKIDRSKKPLLIATVDGHQEWEDVENLCKLFSDEFEAGRRFYAIVHFKQYEPNVRHAARLGEWNRDNSEMLGQYCKGCAMVAPDSIFEIALKAFLIITPFPYPYMVCKDLDKAQTWIDEQRRIHG